MTPTIEKVPAVTVDSVLEMALKLPARDRSELIARIDESLETPESRADLKAAWREELERRLADAELHPEQLLDGETVLAEMEAMLAARRQP